MKHLLEGIDISRSEKRSCHLPTPQLTTTALSVHVSTRSAWPVPTGSGGEGPSPPLHTQAGFHPKLHLPFVFRAQGSPRQPLFYWVLWTLPFRAKGLQQKRHLLGYDHSRDTYKGT